MVLTLFLSYLVWLFSSNINNLSIKLCWASQVALVVKNLPANAGDVKDMGSIPELGRSPGGGNGSPLQYSCLKSPRDRGACQATVYGVTKGQTQLTIWTRTKGRQLHTGQ